MMMNRRDALAVLAGGTLSLADTMLSAAPKKVHATTLLSRNGSG